MLTDAHWASVNMLLLPVQAHLPGITAKDTRLFYALRDSLARPARAIWPLTPRDWASGQTGNYSQVPSLLAPNLRAALTWPTIPIISTPKSGKPMLRL
jgi:hypothetical protein